jgi:hypothetical protein
MTDSKIDKNAAMIAGVSLIPIEAVMAFTHGGLVSTVVGLAGAGMVYIAMDEYKKSHPSLDKPGQEGSDCSLPSQYATQPEETSFWYKLTHGKDVRGQAIDAGQDEENPLFRKATAANTGGIERLTIDEIIAHTEPNSFKLWIGRSLTHDGNPAVLINFYKQHFRFIGASQRGKSSMVGAFLEIVTRTHDQKHVQLILLDKENLTSNLFADVPHVVKMRSQSGEIIKMHATNNDQVLRYLIQTVAIMEKRYQIAEREGVAALKNMPVILVYVEEFLRLKAYFKTQLKTAKDKEQAASDYATLMYCINELAGRGLKARVQLLLCAQVDYADDDFREAMANISCGFSFCVKRDAAMAAGFTNAELLTRNHKENKVGQAVVECPDCNDLVLAPEYDLEARLLAFEKAHPDIHPVHHSPDEPEIERTPSEVNMVNVNGEYLVNEPEKPVNASVNAGEYSPGSVNGSPDDSPGYTQAEETQVLLAYAEMLKAGKQITRTGIRDWLGWNSKHYERIIKPVCDKHSIK